MLFTHDKKSSKKNASNYKERFTWFKNRKTDVVMSCHAVVSRSRNLNAANLLDNVVIWIIYADMKT